MKRSLLTAAIIACTAIAAFAQTYMTRTGRAYFNATTKNSPEVVEAKNNEVACILDSKTGDVRFQVLIRSFKFERATMQEHFNENYMESDKFPKSDFKGSITNLSEVNFTKDGAYTAKVTGKLTIRGITKDVTTQGSVTVKGNNISVKAKFPVLLKDYNISIPQLVADKLDKTAHVSIDCELAKK
ncbi:MAG: YceI family protein [Flavipsychrobacter sp.]|jgi:polyisoprenoid-binding protein YceI|nr:YceI family protein [Flavipsychrobacter sp.]